MLAVAMDHCREADAVFTREDNIDSRYDGTWRDRCSSHSLSEGQTGPGNLQRLWTAKPIGDPAVHRPPVVADKSPTYGSIDVVL